jgi:hypothetical protein
MNKKIAIFIAALFTGSIQLVYAPTQQELVVKFTQAEEKHKRMDISSHRDRYNFSNTYDAYLDAYRNQALKGGPSRQQFYAYCSDENHQRQSYMIAAHVVTSQFNSVGIRVEAPNHAKHDSYDGSSSYKPDPLMEMEKKVIAKVHAAIPAPTVVIQPAVTVAQTAEQRFQVALEEIQKHSELQDYAAALAAARK